MCREANPTPKMLREISPREERHDDASKKIHLRADKKRPCCLSGTRERKSRIEATCVYRAFQTCGGAKRHRQGARSPASRNQPSMPLARMPCESSTSQPPSFIVGVRIFVNVCLSCVFVSLGSVRTLLRRIVVIRHRRYVCADQ